MFIPPIRILSEKKNVKIFLQQFGYLGNNHIFYKRAQLLIFQLIDTIRLVKSYQGVLQQVRIT